MRNNALLLLFMIPMTLRPVVAQNSIMLQGTVQGLDGFPLSEAHVVDIESHEGTITDARGAFSLSVPDTSAVLRISHVGYHPLFKALPRSNWSGESTSRLSAAPPCSVPQR